MQTSQSAVFFEDKTTYNDISGQTSLSLCILYFHKIETKSGDIAPGPCLPISRESCIES